jgi:hypothetical protein
MPAVKEEKLTTHAGSDLRQLEIQHNQAVRDAQIDALASSTDVVWSWQLAAANSIQAFGRGSTDTAVATGRFVAAFQGVPEIKAAVTTGLALTAQTVPADLWALYAIDCVTGGTLSVAPAALNTTGYATEALAIAALPARITAKARLGYLTVKTMAATQWIGATDALAGGTTGNEASITNYYPYDGLMAPTGTALGPNGVVTAAAHPAWSGGRNGVIIPTVLAIGSTDVRVSTTAFVYSANGVTNINKAAVTAGTAFGALGTIPADKWGIIVFLIDAVGTITYLSGPDNYVNGYKNEAAAIGDLNKVFPSNTSTVQLCMFAYCTIKTKVATAFVVGTDSPVGGVTGNVASATNYYPTSGVALLQGQSSFLLANREGTVLTSAQY